MKKIIYIIPILIAFFIGIENTKAANVSITPKSYYNTVVVGNTFDVTVYVSSSSALGSWDFTVGNSSNLRLVSGSSHVVGYVSNSSTYTKTYTLKYKALSSGSASVYINSASVYGFDESSMSVTKGTRYFTLKTTEQIQASYSKNNDLKSITLDKGELSPSFDDDVTEYTVELEPETESIKVSASVEDSTAKVSGTGTHELEEGDNKIELVVTAQNGTKQTYKIIVTVKEYNPIKVSVDGAEYSVVRKSTDLEAPLGYTDATVNISGEDVPAFKSDITGYTLVTLKNSEGEKDLFIYDNGYTLYSELSFEGIRLYPTKYDGEIDGYTKTKVEYNETEIDAFKLSNGSAYSIIYGMNLDTGNTNLYMYDSIEDTLQIYNREEIEIKNDAIDKYKSYIMYLTIGASVLFLGLIVSLLTRKKAA